MTSCITVEEIKEKLVVEQILDVLPQNLKIWINDRRPSTGEEAGRLANDYMHCYCQEFETIEQNRLCVPQLQSDWMHDVGWLTRRPTKGDTTNQTPHARLPTK